MSDIDGLRHLVSPDATLHTFAPQMKRVDGSVWKCEQSGHLWIDEFEDCHICGEPYDPLEPGSILVEIDDELFVADGWPAPYTTYMKEIDEP